MSSNHRRIRRKQRQIAKFHSHDATLHRIRDRIYRRIGGSRLPFLPTSQLSEKIMELRSSVMRHLIETGVYPARFLQ